MPTVGRRGRNRVRPRRRRREPSGGAPHDAELQALGGAEAFKNLKTVKESAGLLPVDEDAVVGPAIRLKDECGRQSVREF